MALIVSGAMAAAVHGVVRASLDTDAPMGAGVAVARDLQRELAEKGYGADLRFGDADDPIPALLEVTDPFANRVDLLAGLRGVDAMKAHTGGPVDLVDAPAVIEMDPSGLDRALARRIAAGFGREAARRSESLLVGTD